jgi:hypothetical protein
MASFAFKIHEIETFRKSDQHGIKEGIQAIGQQVTV